MSYDRRTLLKYMAGASTAGLLAGCGEQADGNGNGNGNGNETVTTIGGERCPEGCDCSVVEPEADSGSFELWYDRSPAAANLIEGSENRFNLMDGPELKLTEITSNYQDKLRNDLSSNQGPDAFEWAHDLMGEFVNNDFLRDISDDLRVDECVFTDRAWDAVNYEGGVYGLPFAAETPALIYNQDILDEVGAEPPETIEEMKTIMDDYDGDYGFGQPIDSYHAAWAGHMFGSVLYDGEELGLDEPEFAEGLRVLLEELKPYMPGDGGYEAQTSIFADGAAPFLLTGPWEITGILEDVDFNVGVTTIPDKDDGTARPYMGVQVMYVTNMPEEGSETATAAREFIEWYATSDNRQLNLANNAGYLPTKVNLSGSDELPSLVEGFTKQTEEAVLMPKNPDLADVWGPWEDVVSEAFSQGLDDFDLEGQLESAAEDIRSAWDE